MGAESAVTVVVVLSSQEEHFAAVVVGNFGSEAACIAVVAVAETGVGDVVAEVVTVAHAAWQQFWGQTEVAHSSGVVWNRLWDCVP